MLAVKEPLPFTPGELLAGKYRVERLLGEGGVGVVVAATNEALRQRVAIKLLRAGTFATTESIRRFEREGRAAASLRSQHVARVLDIGALDDGRPYMVMEYLDGQDLGDLVEKGPLPPRLAVDYVLQACEAIAEAHANGIIHRDLKPRNLFLTRAVDGTPFVKVLDFGISKVEGADQDMGLTRTTEIIGSPSYMSPEQLRSSKTVDSRTDIWALGVILYELLTGRLPFYAHTITELVALVITEREPEIRSVRSDIPQALAAIVSRCLEKQADARFPSVNELVRALERFGTDESTVGIEHAATLAAPSEPGLGFIDSAVRTRGGTDSSKRGRGRIAVALGAFVLVGAGTGLVVARGRMSSQPAATPAGSTLIEPSMSSTSSTLTTPSTPSTQSTSAASASPTTPTTPSASAAPTGAVASPSSTGRRVAHPPGSKKPPAGSAAPSATSAASVDLSNIPRL